MTLSGILTGIFIADDPKSLVSRRIARVAVMSNGFAGDKHAGWFRNADARSRRYPKGTRIWNSRQISIVSTEELAAIADALGAGRVEPEWLGANMCILGISDFSLLAPRTKIFIPNDDGGPEVGFYVTASNKPCIGPGKVIESHNSHMEGLAVRFPDAAVNRRGVVAVVEHCGTIKEGATVSVVIQ